MIERSVQQQQQHQQQKEQRLLLKKKRRRQSSVSRPISMLLLPRSLSSSFMMVLLFLAVSLLSSSTSVVVQAEDDTSYDYSDLSGQLKMIRHCDVNIVYVNSLYLTCDSPGSYYYGSGGYRKSSRCKYGDKADMYIFFTISDSYGWYGIDVTIDMGVLASFSNVQPQTALCDLGSITYLGDKASSSTSSSSSGSSSTSSSGSSANDNNIYCPTPGHYLLHWSFTMPSGGADRQLQFLPDIRIKFNAQDGNATLGCAGTGTAATVQNAVMHIKEGEIALGIALSAFFLVFGCCLAMAYRRKKQVEEGTKGRVMQRRYYFARNAETGEIVPIHHRDGGHSPNHLDPQQYDPQHYELQQHYEPQQNGQRQQHGYRQQQQHGQQQQQYPPSTGYAPSTRDQYLYESYDNTSLGETDSASWEQQRRSQQQHLDKPIMRF